MPAWLSSRNTARLVAAALVVVGAGLRLAHLDDVQQRTPDEQVYTVCAATMLERGPGTVADFARSFVATPALWHYPPPVRVGHLALIAGVMAVTGDRSAHAAALASLLASVLALALLAVVADLAFGPWTGAIAVLLVAVSPADLAMARRAWADGPLALVSLLLIGAGMRAATEPRDLRARVAFPVAAALAALVKEAGLAVSGVAALALAFAREDLRPRFVSVAREVLLWAAAMLAAFAIAAALAGGPASLVHVYRILAAANATNEYVRTYQSGSPLYYLVGMARLQPLALLGGLVAAVAFAIRPGLAPGGLSDGRRRATRFAALSCLGVFAAAALTPVKNLRFLSPILPPLAMLAAAGLVALLTPLVRRRRALPMTVVAGVALAAIAWLDWSRFLHLFVARGVADLVTPWLAP